MRLSSLPGKLLAALLVPTLLTFAAFGFLAHAAARRALEDELSRRLCAIAAAAAAQISEDSAALLVAGDEDSRTYRNLKRRLVELQEATQAARIYLFDQALTARVDTADAPIGARLYSLDASRAELRAVFAGQARSSLLFRGKDGRLYKSGYAPVQGRGGAREYAVGVDGSAALFAELLALRRTLILFGSGGVLAVAALALYLSRLWSRPLRQLTQTARGIGQGDLTRPVPQPALRGRDEVAVLAQALEAMRAALRCRDERLQMMLSGIAHEVRNPLGGMELFAGLLRDELSGAAPPDVAVAGGYVARIEREVGHLKAVVSDFLEYARRPGLMREQVALLPLLREVAESTEATKAQAGAVAVVVAEAPELEALTISADPHQLRRALLNLARNAVQACAGAPPRDGPAQEGHQVRLALSATADEAQIQVSDTGPGIPADVLPRIYVPFFTTREQGTGLGLAFVKEISADHGGSMEVTTGPSGTTFTLRLPRGAAPPQQAKSTERSDGEHPDH